VEDADAPVEWAEDENAGREEAGISTRGDKQYQSWWKRVFGG
jgi:hypothetical protein